MYKSCKIPQSAERQWQIAQNMVRLMQRQAYAGITISGLCREAGIQRRVFYRYFDNVDDVFQLLVDHMLVEYATFVPPACRAREGSSLWDMVKFFSFWMCKKDWLDALDRNQMSGELVIRIIRSSNSGMLDMHLPKGLSSQRSEIAAAYVLSGLFAVLKVWYLQDFSTPVDEMASLTVELMTQPLYQQRP